MKKPRVGPWLDRPNTVGRGISRGGDGLYLAMKMAIKADGKPYALGQKGLAMPNQKIGRDAETGKFTTVEVARERPKTHIVETIKRPSPPPPAKPKKP
jgi:hypothetical protein